MIVDLMKKECGLITGGVMSCVAMGGMGAGIAAAGGALMAGGILACKYLPDSDYGASRRSGAKGVGGALIGISLMALGTGVTFLAIGIDTNLHPPRWVNDGVEYDCCNCSGPCVSNKC